MRAMALAQPADSTVSPLSAGVEADYVALQAVPSRSAVFRSSSTIALTRDCARRDLGAATDRDRHSADVRLALAEVRSPAASPYLLELGQQLSTGANAPRGQSLESLVGITGEELLVGQRRQQDLSAGDTTGRHTGAQT